MAKRCYKGIETLLNYWRQVRHGNPCFSVWDKEPASLVIYYCGDNENEAEAVLANWVESIENDAQFSDCYTFKTHAETTKPERFGKSHLINVDFSPSEDYAPKPGAVVNGVKNSGNDFIAMQLHAIESKLKALEDRKIEDQDDGEDDAPEDGGGWLGAIQTPAGQQLVTLGALLLERLTDRLLPAKPEAKIITNLAGVPDQDDAGKAAAIQYVEILMKKGVTLEHLRKLAEMPGIKIKTLLSML